MRSRKICLSGQLLQSIDIVSCRVQQQQRPHILSVGKTLFGQRKVPSRKRSIANGFPSMLDISFASDFKGDGKVVEGESEIEAMFRVRRDIEGHFFIALPLKETGDFILLVIRNVFENLSS